MFDNVQIHGLSFFSLPEVNRFGFRCSRNIQCFALIYEGSSSLLCSTQFAGSKITELNIFEQKRRFTLRRVQNYHAGPAILDQFNRKTKPKFSWTIKVGIKLIFHPDIFSR